MSNSQPTLTEEIGKVNEVDRLIREFEMYQDTVDCVTDSSEVLENFERSITRLKLKQFEMELIAYIAFHSDESHIVEMRKNLFAIVKMGHSAEIKKVVDVLEEKMTEQGRIYSSNCVYAEPSFNVREKGIRHIIRNYLHDFANNWVFWFRRQIMIGSEYRKIKNQK